MALFLAGCANYQVQLLGNPSDQDKYLSDLHFCAAAATAYKPSISIPDILTGTVKGAAGNAVGGVVGGPLVVGVGAAGGGTAALADGLDLMGQARPNVFRNCMIELTHRDGSAIIANPN